MRAILPSHKDRIAEFSRGFQLVSKIVNFSFGILSAASGNEGSKDFL